MDTVRGADGPRNPGGSSFDKLRMSGVMVAYLLSHSGTLAAAGESEPGM